MQGVGAYSYEVRIVRIWFHRYDIAFVIAALFPIAGCAAWMIMSDGVE